MINERSVDDEHIFGFWCILTHCTTIQRTGDIFTALHNRTTMTTLIFIAFDLFLYHFHFSFFFYCSFFVAGASYSFLFRSLLRFITAHILVYSRFFCGVVAYSRPALQKCTYCTCWQQQHCIAFYQRWHSI